MGMKGNKSRTGMVNSPEMRKHISEGLKGNKCGLGNKSRTGQKRSHEEIAKQIATREATGVNFHTDETKRKLSEQRKGKPHPAHDKIVKMCKARTGWKHTDEAKSKMSEFRKGKPVTPQCLAKATEANTGRVKTKDERDRIRSTLLSKRDMLVENGKKVWSDPDRAKIMVSKMRKAKQLRPNKIESYILELLSNNFPNEWQYVGDGSLVIGTKNPDFVRNHGHNQVIEIYGDYWHQGENPQDRIDTFDKFGYQTLVIWESEFHEMKEQGFVQRILKFMQEADLFYYNPTTSLGNVRA